MSRTVSVSAAALLAAVVLFAGPQRCHGGETPAAELAIENALGEPTQLEFIETPLPDVVDYLKDYHDIQIQIDRRALEFLGLDPSIITVTANIRGVSLRSALDLILRQHDLTYLVDDEMLLITTPEEAQCRPITTLYPVADLIASRDADQQQRLGKTLVRTITTCTEPESWAASGGPGSIAVTSFDAVPTLVVTQSYAVHRRIAEYLADQRSAIQAQRHAATAQLAAGPKHVSYRIGWSEADEKAAEKMDVVLQQPTHFDFVEEPLERVAEYFKRLHQVEVQVDRGALEYVGLDPSDVTITRNVKGISLGSALRLVLHDVDLTYAIENEVLLITTPEEGPNRLATKVYPVTDLAASCRIAAPRPFLCSACVPVVGAEDTEVAQLSVGSETCGVPTPTEPPGEADGITALTDMVTALIDPESWDTSGGPASIADASIGGVDVLIVSQTWRAHEQIVQLLGSLRKMIADEQSVAAPVPEPPPAPPRAVVPERKPADPLDDPFGP